MGDLREQLLKAKLISQKQAKKAKREKQLEKKKLSPDTLESKQQAKKDVYQNLKLKKADADRKREEQKRKEIQRKNSAARLRDIVMNSEIRKGRTGNYRFYFVARNSRIPFIEISQRLAEELQNGHAAIVETPGETSEIFRVIRKESALKLKLEAPEYVLFFNES